MRNWRVVFRNQTGDPPPSRSPHPNGGVSTGNSVGLGKKGRALHGERKGEGGAAAGILTHQPSDVVGPHNLLPRHHRLLVLKPRRAQWESANASGAATTAGGQATQLTLPSKTWLGETPAEGLHVSNTPLGGRLEAASQFPLYWCYVAKQSSSNMKQKHSCFTDAGSHKALSGGAEE